MVREEGIGPSAFAYQTKILTVILLPHIIQLVGYPGTPRGGLNMCPALGPIRTDARIPPSRLQGECHRPLGDKSISREGFDEGVPVTRHLPIVPFAAYHALFILPY